MTVRSELEALIDANGLLHPSTIVEWARQHPDSELHAQFEWNDSKAADAYRLGQARRLIAVHIRDVEGHRTTFSLVSDRSKGNGFRDIDEVVDVTTMRAEAVGMALRELGQWAERFFYLRGERVLAPFFALIDRIGQPEEEPPTQTRQGQRRRGSRPSA